MRARRIEMGLSQEDLARLTNISVFTISRTESGASNGMRLETLVTLAKALLYDPEDLLIDEDEEGEANE
jgi:transcriptional regulator with XRE-family HTH domain